eukprot:6783931-Prymnesium_polylepis.1
MPRQRRTHDAAADAQEHQAQLTAVARLARLAFERVQSSGLPSELGGRVFGSGSIWQCGSQGAHRICECLPSDTAKLHISSRRLTPKTLCAAQVLTVCTLPNGDGENDRLASASQDRTVRLWRLSDASCLRVLCGHEDDVSDCCPLGSTQLVSVSHDKTVRVWNAETGICDRILKGHKHDVLVLCTLQRTDDAVDALTRDSFSSDRTAGAQPLIVSASADKTIRVWEMDEILWA